VSIFGGIKKELSSHDQAGFDLTTHISTLEDDTTIQTTPPANAFWMVSSIHSVACVYDTFPFIVHMQEKFLQKVFS
jgi:hypothetical protein